jgi:hypothetical protein
MMTILCVKKVLQGFLKDKLRLRRFNQSMRTEGGELRTGGHTNLHCKTYNDDNKIGLRTVRQTLRMRDSAYTRRREKTLRQITRTVRHKITTARQRLLTVRP